MSKQWEINPGTKDYVMESGSPVETGSLKIPAYFRLKVRRGAWMYAPDSEYGSDLHTIKKNRSSQDASKIEAVAARALQPIADDGRAETIDVSVVEAARHGLGLKIDILDAQGETDSLNLEKIGI